MLGVRFTSYGCETIVETDSSQLFETYLSLKPDYVALAIGASHFDFHSLYTRLTHLAGMAHTHFIIITPKERLQEFAIVRPLDTVLLTPFDIEDLDADVYRNRPTYPN